MEVPMDETCGTVAFSHKSMPSGIVARTWYRIVGRVGNGRLPLVVLHGGPGYTHAYLKPAFDLFSRTTSTPVIYYDQFGNGNSTHLREKRLDESFWTVDLFTQELDNLLTKLDIVGDFNLYGHSWGAMLAISYVSRYQPKGLRKLVLGSGPASMVLWKEAARGFLEQLPPHMMERLDTTKPWEELEGDDDYLEALAALNKKTTLMDEPFPEELQESLNWLNEDDTVVLTANGPSDLITGGSMKALDVSQDCVNLSIPVLILSGDRDGATQVTIEPLCKNIPAVQWVTLGNCGHMAHLENTSLYVNNIIGFLKEE